MKSQPDTLIRDMERQTTGAWVSSDSVSASVYLSTAMFFPFDRFHLSTRVCERITHAFTCSLSSTVKRSVSLAVSTQAKGKGTCDVFAIS